MFPKIDHEITRKYCVFTQFFHSASKKLTKNQNFTYFFVYFFGGLDCVSHSLAYIAHFVFLRDVWI